MKDYTKFKIFAKKLIELFFKNLIIINYHIHIYIIYEIIYTLKKIVDVIKKKKNKLKSLGMNFSGSFHFIFLFIFHILITTIKITYNFR